MEIRIGIQNVAREVVLESELSNAEVNEKLAAAMADGSVLSLTDPKGREVLVPAAGIAYVEVGPEEIRRVGFAH